MEATEQELTVLDEGVDDGDELDACCIGGSGSART
jgi:hypothetical protein